MTMYRAVLKKDWEKNPTLRRLPTNRVPSNVPYLVDNIWEYLRPAEAPSRRQAIYASPDPEQTLKSASVSQSEDNPLLVCEVQIEDEGCRIAHLSVSDARYHPDIQRIMWFASRFFARMFAGLGEAQHLGYAPLFMPATSAAIIGQLLARPELAELHEVARTCTIWKEAKFHVVPSHDGELFFELSDAGVCRLTPQA